VSERPHASILGGSLALGASTALRLVASFAIAILVARLLGAEAKGQLALLQQFPAIAALLLGLGFETAHAYYVGRQGRDPGSAISDSLALTMLASVVGLPLTALLMREFVPALAAVPTSTVLVASASLPLLMLTALLGGVLTGQGRLPGQALAQSAATLTSLTAIVAWALLGELTLEQVVVATVIALGVGVVGSAIATRVRSLPRPSLARLREEFPYARRSYVQGVTGYLEMRQDIVLLGLLASAAGVGVYTVGVSLAELLFYAPQTIAAALTARSLQEGAESGAALTAQITRLLTAFLLVAAVGLALLARPLVVAVFGAAFAESAAVIVILVPGIVVWGIASQPGAYLATHGRLFPRMSTATLLLNLTLNLALIPTLGARGAAIATAISYSIISGYIIRTFLRETETSLRDLLVMRADDMRYALAAARALRKPAA
jgi:O-antigen/teichoic acid export membrane protein